MDYDTICNNLQNGVYKNKKPYPSSDSRGIKPIISKTSKYYSEVLKEYEEKENKFKALRDEYNKENARLRKLFEADCIKYGMEYVSNVSEKIISKVFAKAYDRGYSHGYFEVLNIFSDLLEIFSD